MHWLFTAARRLRELGILGMNERNAACILDHNPKALFRQVDDKLRMSALCEQIGVPTPRVYGVLRAYAELHRLPAILGGRSDFVVKPNCGSGGKGILVLVGGDGDRLLRHSGERMTLDQLREHLADILSGMHSLGGRPDQAILQQRVRLHPAFEAITFKGIPDIRVVLYRNEPAMAMLRLPTSESNGRANLHQGGIGTGIDLESGVTHHAVQRNHFMEIHPDTGESVVGRQVPYWDEVLRMARRVAEATGLGYVGVDIVLDAEGGPLLLEANARPGLAIQIANAEGLRPRLAEIDGRKDRGEQAVAVAGTAVRQYRKSA